MTGAAIRSLSVRGVELALSAPIRTAAGTVTLAGIDMALWDRDARRAEVTLAEFLGGGASAVAAYRPLSATEPVSAVAEAQRAVEAGFAAIKVKLGRGDLRRDLETVDALGGVGRLMVDYNQSLSVPEALRRGQALDERGVEWIEEPIDARDLPGHAHVRAQLSTPLAAGENLEGPVEIQAALDLGALDVLTLDAARTGGVTGWLAAASAAARLSVPVCSHAYPEFSLHLLAASPTGGWLEYQDYVAPILAAPLEVVAGELRIPDRLGAGMEWDERALARLG